MGIKYKNKGTPIENNESSIMNFEELKTLVTQIDALLNPFSADVNVLQSLTPGLFLVEGTLISISETNSVLESLHFVDAISKINSGSSGAVNTSITASLQ